MSMAGSSSEREESGIKFGDPATSSERDYLEHKLESSGVAVQPNMVRLLNSLTRRGAGYTISECLGRDSVSDRLVAGLWCLGGAGRVRVGVPDFYTPKTEPDDPAIISRVSGDVLVGAEQCSEADLASILEAFRSLISFPPKPVGPDGRSIAAAWVRPGDDIIDRVLLTLNLAAQKRLASQRESARQSALAEAEARRRRDEAEAEAQRRRDEAEAEAQRRRDEAEAEAQRRRDEAEAEAQRRREAEAIARLDDERRYIGVAIVRNAQGAVDDYGQMPNLLEQLRAAESEAQHYYADGAFSPFWSAIEKAYSTLGEFGAVAQRLERRASEHGRLVQHLCELEVSPSGVDSFPITLDGESSKKTIETALTSLGAIVYEAQKHPVFAQIWEQRRMTAAVESGFQTLEGAVRGMSRQLVDSLDGLSSQLASSARVIHEAIESRQQPSLDVAQPQQAAMAELLYNSDQIRKALAQQTWGNPYVFGI